MASVSIVHFASPLAVATKLLAGFEQRDPLLNAFLEDFVLLRVEDESPTEGVGFRARSTLFRAAGEMSSSRRVDPSDRENRISIGREVPSEDAWRAWSAE